MLGPCPECAAIHMPGEVCPKHAERKVVDTLCRMAGMRPIPKAGLLATTAHNSANRACQLIVE